jgi:hypothetical protein
MAKATTKAAKPKAAPKPAKAAGAPVKTKAPAKAKHEEKAKSAPKPKTLAKPKTPAKSRPKAAKPEPGIIKQTTDAISQLAADILADRIVPTIEQIKSIAASALAQDKNKGKRPKK